MGVLWSVEGWGLDVLPPARWGDTGLLDSSGDFREHSPGTSEVFSAPALSWEIKGIPCFPVAICQRISFNKAHLGACTQEWETPVPRSLLLT